MIEELEKRLTPDGIHLNYLESLGLIEYIRKGMLDEVSLNCQQEEKIRLRRGDGVLLPLDEDIWWEVRQSFYNAGAKGEALPYFNKDGKVLLWTRSTFGTYDSDSASIQRILTPDQAINAENA